MEEYSWRLFVMISSHGERTVWTVRISNAFETPSQKNDFMKDGDKALASVSSQRSPNIMVAM
jgi:hypothetical protein